MWVAWCPKHRGVMRISFFDPPTPHFEKPCPRCGEALKTQIRNKYELTTPIEGTSFPERDCPWCGENRDCAVCDQDFYGE